MKVRSYSRYLFVNTLYFSDVSSCGFHINYSLTFLFHVFSLTNCGRHVYDLQRPQSEEWIDSLGMTSHSVGLLLLSATEQTAHLYHTPTAG